MTNNFRDLNSELTINIQEYVSKSGHDSNDGLTPNTPKKTIPTNTNKEGYVQVGTGIYDLGGATIQRKLISDGKVIINNGVFEGDGVELYGVDIKNSKIVCDGDNHTHVFTNCTLVECDGLVGWRSKLILDNCILRNFKNPLYLKPQNTNSISLIESSIFKDVTIVHMEMLFGIEFISTFFDKDVTIINHPIVMGTTDGIIKLFQYNNFRGTFKFSGDNFSDGKERNYVIKDDLVGSPQDNGYDENISWLNQSNLREDGYLHMIEGIDDAISTCINKEPLFNNIELGDFSLQAASPHIGAGGGNSNIGGTEMSISITNKDNGVGNVEVIASPQIDTSNPNYFVLKPGESEGYIDYYQKLGSEDVVLGKISPISKMHFDSDEKGGEPTNNNVPDSSPITTHYPITYTTTSISPDKKTLIVVGHNAEVGEFVRVNGEDREIIDISSTKIILSEDLRGVISSGITIQVGSKEQLAMLRPNRLSYLLRTSKMVERPYKDTHWDNDLDNTYNMAGKFISQEWDKTPGYFIDNESNEVLGTGESKIPSGLNRNEISCKWINLRVYLRNNYNS